MYRRAAPQLGQFIVPVGIGAFGQGRVVSATFPMKLVEAQQLGRAMRRAARWETHKNKSSTVSSVSPRLRVVAGSIGAWVAARPASCYPWPGIGVGNGSPHQQVIVVFFVMNWMPLPCGGGGARHAR